MLATKPPEQTIPAAPRRAFPWALLLFEAGAIFASVFLAFGVTEWRQTRREAAMARETLERFHAEVARNRAAVAEGMPYHMELRNGILRVQQDDAVDNIWEAMYAAGWKNDPGEIPLREGAWRTAEATGALALLDAETAGLLSSVYEVQADFERRQGDFATGVALNPVTWQEDGYRATLTSASIYFQMVTGLEHTLLQLYAEALDHIDARLGLPEWESAAPADSLTARAP